MREERERIWGKANWITGAAMIFAYFVIGWIFPAMETRWKLLAALAVAAVVSTVIYLVKKKQKEKEEEEKLPPV